MLPTENKVFIIIIIIIIIDPDQRPQNAASDQGLHGLPRIQLYLRPINRY